MKAILIALFLFPSIVSSAELTFIVNKKNTNDSITHDELKQIYKAENYSWPNSSDIQVVDYKKNTAQKKLFCKEFLMMSPLQLYKKWIRSSLEGKGKPVMLYSSSEEIIKYVEGNKDAIGYLIGSKDKSGRVKVLSVK